MMQKEQCLFPEPKTSQDQSDEINTSSEESPFTRHHNQTPNQFQEYPKNINDMRRFLVRQHCNVYLNSQFGIMRSNYFQEHRPPFQEDSSR
jgi:hypothetical protein